MTPQELSDLATEGINAVNEALKEEFRDRIEPLIPEWHKEQQSREVKP